MIRPFSKLRIILILEGGSAEAESGEPPGDAGQGDQEQLGEAETLGRPHGGPEAGKQVHFEKRFRLEVG